jgi:pentatricopeptide repeat protein
MKGYVQEGQVGDAIDFLLAMEQKFDPNVSPNEVTYTTAIAACVRLNLMDEAHSILREMGLRKVPANIVTYNILLSGYCRSRNMEKAYALVADMKLAGISLDVVSYNTLINGCIKSGDNVAALAHFQQMREAGIAPSEVSYTTLMKAFGQSGQPRLVHQVFEEMQADPRMRPDSVAWNVLIDSICQSDRMADAKSAFKRMKEARYLLCHVFFSS